MSILLTLQIPALDPSRSKPSCMYVARGGRVQGCVREWLLAGHQSNLHLWHSTF